MIRVPFAHAARHELAELGWHGRKGRRGRFIINLRSAEAVDSSSPTSKSAATFLRVSPRDPGYFELSDGAPYVPIGLNMIAPPGDKGLPGMEAWMTQLSTNGGNYLTKPG